MPAPETKEKLYNNKERVRELIAEAQSGSEMAKTILVEENMPLVNSIVSRFTYGAIEREDLMQIGIIGLIKAIKNFDLTYDNAFSTYAVPRILGEVRRGLRDDNPVYVCRSLKEMNQAIHKVEREFTQEHDKKPTITEISQIMNIPIEKISECLNAALKPSSLQQQIGESGELEQFISGKDGEEIWLSEISLKDGIESLPERLAYVVRARYFEEKTQGEIAKNLGVSQVQVSRLEKQGLELLKKQLI